LIVDVLMIDATWRASVTPLSITDQQSPINN